MPTKEECVIAGAINNKRAFHKWVGSIIESTGRFPSIDAMIDKAFRAGFYTGADWQSAQPRDRSN